MTALGQNVVITGGTITLHNTDGHGGRSEEGALNPHAKIVSLDSIQGIGKNGRLWL